MDDVVNAGHNTLKRMLEDGNAAPMHLPFALLEDITNAFSDDHVIGNGGFAVVYKGVVGHGMIAVKKLTNTFDLEETKFHKEIECLVKAKHKNIVCFLGYCAETQGQVADFDGKFVMADTRNWLLCFEYLPNGSLDKYITDASCGLEWDERFKIIKGICNGICYLHAKRILHLDLKPANILIADHMIPKIADFGLSRCLDEAQTRVITSHLRGSVGYLPLEFFRGEVAFTSDIYSLGVIIVEILTGEKGYPEDESVVESWMNRLEGDMQLEQVRVCTKIGIECMELDPKKRPAARHIIDRLEKITNVDETADIEDSARRLQTLGDDESEEKEVQWSLWRLQYQLHQSVSSSNSSVFRKLSNLDIFKRKSRRNFMRNGGPTIQQSNKVHIFRKEDLKPILDKNNLVGRGGFGDVYQGILRNRLVAIRKPIAGSLLRDSQFADQVINRSEVIHRNILRLIGCCLEVDVPMLIYELFYNGSLGDILHSNIKMPLNSGVRLRIATQVADGLAYTHSGTNRKFLICGFDAANILLDDNFEPKISEFAILEALELDAHNNERYPLRPIDTGSAPYNYRWDKRDVYSFGVIILELISRKKAIYDNGDILLQKFLECHKEGRKATELYDKEIARTRDLEILDNLAEIGVDCVQVNRDARPSMGEVAGRLLTLSRMYTD